MKNTEYIEKLYRLFDSFVMLLVLTSSGINLE